MPSLIAVLIIAVAVVACSWDAARGQDMTLLEHHCQDHSHEPNSDDEKACDEIYEYIREHGADAGYNAQKHLTVGNADYYGQAACDGNLSTDQCTKCVGAAYEFAIMQCTFSNGAQVKFQSCRFRVDNYNFDLNW